MNPGVFKLLCPFQVRWLRETAPLAIAEKSRRIGWTWTHALGAVLNRIDPDRPRSNYYHSSADETAAKEFIDYCAEWARMANAVALISDEKEVIEDREIHTRVMTFDCGTKIVAGTSNPNFFRSKGGEVGLDEYAFHRDAHALFKAAHATALFWRHPMRIWSTHNGPASQFNSLIGRARQGKLKAAVHRVTIYDAVEDGIVERIVMRQKKLDHVPDPDEGARQAWLDELHATCQDEESWNEEFNCIAADDNSSLLSYERIDSAVAANLKLCEGPLDLPDDGDYYAGYDVGRTHDFSVLWVMQKIADVYWTRLLTVLDRQRFAIQEQIIAALMNNRRVRRICIDKSGLGMQLAEQACERWPGRAEGVSLSNPVKHSLGMGFKGLFADRLIRIPGYVNWELPEGPEIKKRQHREDWLREDLHKTKKSVTEAGNVRLAADSDAGGHADGFWAGALAHHAADEAKMPLPAPLTEKPAGW